MTGELDKHNYDTAEDRSKHRPSWEQEGKSRLGWKRGGKLLIAMGWGWGIEVRWRYNVNRHLFHTRP